MKNIFVIILCLFSIHTFSQKSAKNIRFAKQTKTDIKVDKTNKKLINQIDSVMAKSYERGLFNGNVLIAKNNKII